MTPSEAAQLPPALADRFRKPFARFLRVEATAGAALLVSVIVALVLANSPWAGHFEGLWATSLGVQLGPWSVLRSTRAWLNDGLMTMFFFLVALELKRELVLGELSQPRFAALSIFAAVGGMVLPVAIYLTLLQGHPGQQGWGTVMSTDTAFLMGCLALLGSRLPQSLRVFMLSVVIVDDVGAILVVAVAYSGQITWEALALAGVGLAIVRGLALGGVRTFPPYFFVGALVWIAFDASGIHATISGVILGLMTPARRWVSDERLYAILGQVIAHPAGQESSGSTRDRDTLLAAEIAAREALSPVERLEIALHPWVGFVIMPLFALANAGLALSPEGVGHPVTLAVIFGFTLGKPLGIAAFTWLAVRSGIATRPAELSWRLIAGGGMLAGIGFTMALFIANMAYPDSLKDSAKTGILLASVFSAFAGFMLLMGLPARNVGERESG